MLTNTVSCGLMMGFGDVLQQRSEHWKHQNRHLCKDLSSNKPDSNAKKDSKKTYTLDDIDDSNTEYQHDYTRTKNMIIVGAVQGPFHHYFYALLDRTLPGKDAVSIVKKTLVDQFVASPTCLAIFFFGLGALEKRRMQDINEEVKLKFMDTWKVSIVIPFD